MSAIRSKINNINSSNMKFPFSRKRGEGNTSGGRQTNSSHNKNNNNNNNNNNNHKMTGNAMTTAASSDRNGGMESTTMNGANLCRLSDGENKNYTTNSRGGGSSDPTYGRGQMTGPKNHSDLHRQDVQIYGQAQDDEQGFDPHGASLLDDNYHNNDQTSFGVARVDYFTEQDPLLSLQRRNEVGGDGYSLEEGEELLKTDEEDGNEEADRNEIEDLIDCPDFGESVEVTHAECRLVEKENLAYDQKIKIAKSSLQQEEATASGLKREKDRAEKSVGDMRQKTEDLLESCLTYKDIMASIRKNFERNIVADVVTTNDTNKSLSVPVTPTAGAAQEGNRSQAVSPQDSIISLEKDLNDDLIKKKSITKDIDALQSDYLRLIAEVKMLETSSTIREKEEQEKQSRDEMNQKETEIVKAGMQLQQLSDDLQSILNRAAAEAKTLGVVSKEHNDLKVKTDAEEDEEKKDMEKFRCELQELQKEEAALDVMLAELEAEEKLAQKQLSLFDEFVVTQEDKKKKLLAVTNEKTAKLELLQQLEKRDEESLTELKAGQARLEEANNSKAAIDKVQHTNEEADKLILAPGQEEMRRLEAKKQDLTSKMSSAHSLSEAQQDDEAEGLKQLQSEKADLDAEINQLKNHINAMIIEKEGLLAPHKKHLEDIKRQIANHKEREKNFNHACEMAEETKDANKLEVDANLQKKYRKMQDELKQQERMKHRYLNILQMAAAMLDDVVATDLEYDIDGEVGDKKEESKEQD